MNRFMKGIAFACALLAIMTTGLTQTATRSLPLKGKIDGITVLYEDGTVGSTIYGGGISNMGHIEMSWHITLTGSTFTGIALLNKNGSQSDDYVTANLTGTVSDSGVGMVYTATGTITGGGGQFQGASGTFTFVASQESYFGGPVYFPVTNFVMDGKIVLPR